MKPCIKGKKNIIAVFQTLSNGRLRAVKSGGDKLRSVFALKLFFKELFDTCFSDNIIHSVAVFFQLGVFLGTDNACYADYVRSKSSVQTRAAAQQLS